MHNIDIKLQPSKQFIALLILLLMGSLLIVSFLPILTPIKIGLFIATLCYGGYILWRDGLLLHPKSLIGFSLDSNRNWLLYNKLEILSGELCGDSTITTLVCVLRFKVRGKRLKYSCVVFKDAVARGLYRKLLVKVRG